MCQPATVPFPDNQPASKPWSPSDRDRLVFQWVKFDGHKQSWVASQLSIHQSTVSRMVDRYERWLAHGGPLLQGCLNYDERLRAQRALTYERNEWILTSALRIAGEMEHAIDRSRSTVTKSSLSPSQELEVRTEHSVLDRSGIAARYLRLAYRINMDQLKLVEQEPLPALEPLSITDAAEDFDNLPLPWERAVAAENPLPPEEGGPDSSGPGEGLSGPGNSFPSSAWERTSPEAPASPPFEMPPAPLPAPHRTHTPMPPESSANTESTTTSYNSSSPEKSPALAYAVAESPPEAVPSSRHSPRSGRTLAIRS